MDGGNVTEEWMAGGWRSAEVACTGLAQPVPPDPWVCVHDNLMAVMVLRGNACLRSGASIGS